MNAPRLIAPSIIAGDFRDLRTTVRRITEGGADALHVDVMDGRFVPNLTIGPLVVRALRALTPLPLDVHLMIVHPEMYIEAFAAAGADWITVHWEACTHLHSILHAIRRLGKKAGVSLNPLTPVDLLDPCLPFVDLVQVMGVNPGFSGQKMIPETIGKVAHLDRLRRERSLPFQIEFDGGITAENLRAVAEAGGDIMVAGSAVFDAQDPAEAIRKLKNA